MYDILNLYEQPYDPKRPVLGMDEKSKQFIEDSRPPIPATPGKTMKQDYEYVRKGTANIFMAVEPKGGKRFVLVTAQRTKPDFAFFMKNLVDVHYPDAIMIRVVLDNLNTHFESSFFESMNEKEARRILLKLEFHYVPKHASWLNVAETEIGIMDTQCTGRRIKDKELLTCEVNAWMKRRNKQRRKIEWTFTKQKADGKLGKYYVT
jgi:hypothetical protein